MITLADPEAAALAELARDPLYHRLTDEYRSQLVQAALSLGFEAAATHGTRPAAALARELGVTVERPDSAPVFGGLAIRAEYDPKGPVVRLFRGNLQGLAAKGKATLEQIEEAALAHELFHHLEHRLPMDTLPRFVLWQLGPWKRAVLPARAREIAAHAFAMAVAGLPFFSSELDA